MRFTTIVHAKKGTKNAGRFYIAYEGTRRDEAFLVARMCVNAINAVSGSGSVTLEGGSKLVQVKNKWTIQKGVVTGDWKQ